MESLSPENTKYLEINNIVARKILTVWLDNTNKHLEKTHEVGLLNLKKILPLPFGVESKFFLFRDLKNRSYCLFELEFAENKEINILEIFDNPAIFVISQELRINIKKTYISAIINLFKNPRYSTLNISVNNQREKKFYTQMGFKMLDPANPDILTYDLRPPFKFNLIR